MLMDKQILEKAEGYTKHGHRRKLWQRIVSMLTCIVVFCTTYALILPAITMEGNELCGIEAHTHTEACYSQPSQAFVCEAVPLHTHDSACYDAENVLVCGYADYLLHTHESLCYDEENRLFCPLPELLPHVHTQECYQLTEVPTVTEVPHAHEEACYTKVYEETAILCTLVETEGHAHEESCYEEPVLTCTTEETAGHSHDTGCYGEPSLSCQLPETQGHAHEPGCYGEASLACGLPEGHFHEDSCYGDAELVCGQEEGADHSHESGCYGQPPLVCQLPENHAHGDSCYTPAPLTCNQEEQEAHTHGESCYTAPLLCGQEEIPAHSHDEKTCYEAKRICGQEEAEAHTHEGDCYDFTLELICTLEEGAPEETTIPEMVEELICTEAIRTLHSHTDACYIDGILSCGLLETQEHIHTENCLQLPEETQEPLLTCQLREHTHSLICYSDGNADLETNETWEGTFRNVTLTGSPADDLLAIARTQLGYTESTANYIVLEDEVTIQGYNRYGVWAGDPYASWNQLFVEFCLSYANVSVDAVPRPVSGSSWRGILAASEKWKDSASVPQPGDLIFLSIAESEATEEYVGIVSAVNSDGYITAILGDYKKEVSAETFAPGDTAILGYVSLPRTEVPETTDAALPEETTGSTVPEELAPLTASFSFQLFETEEPVMQASTFSLRSSGAVLMSEDSGISGQALDGVDITAHITGVTVQWKDSQYSGSWNNWNGEALDPNNMLRFGIAYELPGGILPDDGIVQYQLPVGTTTSGSEGTVRNDLGTEVGTYYISTSGLITIDFNEEYVQRNQAGETIEGSVSFTAIASSLAGEDGSSIDLQFTDSESIHISLEEDTPSDLTVEKTAVKNGADGTISYTIQVSSVSGTATDVILKDYMNANTYLGDLTVLDSSGASVPVTPPAPGDGSFTLTLPPLSENGSYTITFTSKLGAVADKVYPSNRADATSTDTDGDTIQASDDVSLTFDYTNVISKSGELTDGTIQWSIVLNPAQIGGNLKGWTLSDTINGTALSGPVTIRYPNGTTETISSLPHTFQQDITGTVEITYTTDADYALGSSTVTNRAELDPPEDSTQPSFSETQHVDPYVGDESSYNPMQKTAGDMTPNADGSYTINWTLTIDSAKGAIPDAWTLTDTLGSNQYFSEEQRSSLENEKIPALLRVIYGDPLPSYTLQFSSNNRSFTLAVSETLPKLDTPVVLSYASTTDVFDPTLAHTFSNQVGVNNKVWETESIDFFPTISKVDSRTSSGSDSYHALQDLTDQELYWTVRLHIPSGMDTGLTILEDMPDSLTTSGSEEANLGVTLTDLGMTVQGTYYPFTLTETGGSVEFGSYDIPLSWVEGTNDFSISLPADFAAAFPDQEIDFLITGRLPDGFITTKTAEEGADYTSYELVSNQVSILRTGDGTTIGTDTQNQYITHRDTTQYVDKAYLGHEESVVSYSIVINPNAEDLVSQQEWLTVTDDLSYICYQYGQGDYFTASLDPTQIFLTLMDKDGNVADNGERIAITALVSSPNHLAHGSTYTASTNHQYTTWGTTTFHYLLTLKVPDGYRILVEYQYDLDAVGSPGGVQNLTNTARITDINASDEASQGGWLPITESDATANLTGIRIYKVDQSNYAIHLQGAHYDLYQYIKNDDGTGEYQYIRSVVSDGVSQLDLEELEKNTAYYLVETKAPSGYILDESRHYFMVYDDTLKVQDADGNATDEIVYIAPDGFSDTCHMRPGDVLYIENRRYVDDITVAKQWKNANGMVMDDNIPADTYVKVQLYQVFSNYPRDFEADKVGQTATVKITVGSYSYSSEHYSNTTQAYQVGDTIEILYTMDPENDPSPGLLRYTDSENIQIPYTVTENEDGTCTYAFPYRVTGTYIELHGWTYEKDSPVSIIVRETVDYTQANLSRTVNPYEGGLITLNDSNDWYYTFSNLPAYELSENGQILGYYSYYFNEVESSLDGFTPTYDTGYSPSTALNDGRVTIVNTPPPTTSIQVSKDWRNTDGSAIPDPPVSSITFDVYQVENLGTIGDISYAQVTAYVDSWYAPNGGVLKQSIVVPLGMELQLTIQSTAEPDVDLDTGSLPALSVTDLGSGRKEYTYRFYANSDMNLWAKTNSGDSSAKLVTARETSLSPVEGKRIASGYSLSASGGKLYTYNVPGSISNGDAWTALINGLPESAMTDKGMVYYTYYVKESAASASDDYTVTYGYDGKEYLFCPDITQGDLTIHNTRYVGDRIQLNVTKKWTDQDGVEVENPPEEAIDVDVWQVITSQSGSVSERYYRTCAITAENNWQLTISLPAHNTDQTLKYAYYIKETTGSYPVTYQIGNGEIMDAMTKDHALEFNESSSSNKTIYPIILTNTVTVYTLPETGGVGSAPYITAGIALFVLAILTYIPQKTKKERKENI